LNQDGISKQDFQKSIVLYWIAHYDFPINKKRKTGRLSEKKTKDFSKLKNFMDLLNFKV